MIDTIPNRAGKSTFPIWLLLAALVGLVCVLIWRQQSDPGEQHRGVGQSLGVLELQPLTGTASAMSAADLKGKVTLLNFWGTWCPPCRQEFPHLAALAEQYREREDFQLLTVSCGPPGGEQPLDELREATAHFVKATDTSLPTYADAGEKTRGQVDRVVGLRGYPTTLLIDRQGTIRQVWDGYWPGAEEEMALAVANLLME